MFALLVLVFFGTCLFHGDFVWLLLSIFGADLLHSDLVSVRQTICELDVLFHDVARLLRRDGPVASESPDNSCLCGREEGAHNSAKDSCGPRPRTPVVLGQGPLWSWAKDHMWSLANKAQGQARVRGRVPGPAWALLFKSSGLC